MFRRKVVPGRKDDLVKVQKDGQYVHRGISEGERMTKTLSKREPEARTRQQ